MEPSDELPRLDLWLEKLRSSSEAEPHPFTMDPVEHRMFKQVCLILTAEPLKAFFMAFLYTNTGRISKKWLQVRTNCALMILQFLFCCRVRPFIWAQNPTEQTLQNRDGTHARGRAGPTSTGFASLWYRTMSAPAWSRIASEKSASGDKAFSQSSALHQAPGSAHLFKKKHIRHLYVVTFKMDER